jgi:hypothetical protein
LKLLDVSADRFNRPRKINAQYFAFWLGQTGLHAHEVWRARHGVPVHWVHGSRVNAYKHAIVRDDRPLDLSELENIR